MTARATPPPVDAGTLPPPTELVAIGASWGGVDALRFLLSALTPDFPAPIVIAQHRGEADEDGLEKVLRAEAVVDVHEAEDKEPLRKGHVYLAPAGYHLLVEKGSIALSTDAPVAWARPSIDVLFESVAEAFRARAVGVILTGAGKDGPNGMVAIKRRGGLTVVQDPATAEAKILPELTLASVRIDKVLKLPELVPFLSRHLREIDRWVKRE